MNIGERLKFELQERGLVLKFVSKKTGIPYSSLSHYLNNFSPIPESKIRCICLTFGIDPKIFGLDGHTSSQKQAG